jgi:di/tricarboxylate transporter
MSSLLMFLLGVIVGPLVWLILFIIFDLVISSREYFKLKKEAIGHRMRDVLREFGIID